MYREIIDLTQTVVDPLYEILSLAKAKTWLIVDHDEDDELIQDVIDAAVNIVQEYTKRHLQPTSITLILRTTVICAEIVLPRGPVKELTSVESWDRGTFTVMNLANYGLLGDELYGDLFGTYRITYKVGYSTDGADGYPIIPAGLLNCLKGLIAFLYENRGDVTKLEAYTQLDELLQPYINMAWQ